MDPAGVAERLREVRERIARAGGSRVAVIAVTKSFPPEAVLAAIAAGAAPDLDALRTSRKVAHRFEPSRDDAWRRSQRSRWAEAVELAKRWGDR